MVGRKPQSPGLATRGLQILLAAVILVIVFLAAVTANQAMILQKAHSSFEDYYAFRDCRQLLAKSATSATCETSGGQVIKLVEYQNKWYLDGDLPACIFHGTICF